MFKTENYPLVKRLVDNLFIFPSTAKKYFGSAECESLVNLISNIEKQTTGELKLVVENDLEIQWVLQGCTSKDRALGLFSSLRVWDTEDNCGVLIYILLSEHRFEIIADRGIHKKIPQTMWDKISEDACAHFCKTRYVQGVTTAIEQIGNILINEFPQHDSDHQTNDVSNEVHII